ncbi:MAG: HAD-IA family hydrolase, partial [Planctomycetes bacterium]|nr:HAD-IA family hydrolase [Planctomycetota bacterium]
VYDAVGTLIHVHPSVAAIYAEVGQRFGSNLEPDEIRRRFRAAFARQERLDQDAGWRTDEPREFDRWRQIVAEVLDDVADLDACFADLFAAFGQSSAWSSDPDAEALMQMLHARGIRQAMASNFDRRLRAVMAPMPIAAYLDPVVVSSEVGWRKPARAFFEHVAISLALPASEILFIGDDVGNDYEPARDFGMRAVLFDPHRTSADVKAMQRLRDVIDFV